ncbi:MAG: heme-copper oxidase subunit III [Microthrixaceae bacterium]
MTNAAAPQIEDIASEVEFPDDEHLTATGISNEKLGMWVYLASDILLFGGMISTYMIYRNRPGNIPGLAGNTHRISEYFDIPFTSMTSFILLMSSLTMVLSVNAIIRHDYARLRLWLSTTALLGALFLGGQAYEFQSFVSKDNMGFTANVGASAFYALTGLHGVHVAIGVIMLLVLLALSFGRTIKPEAVEVVGLYWHFVDIVWVVIFTIVYLIP